MKLKNHMTIVRGAGLVAFALLGAPSLARAETVTIPVQGVLADLDGRPRTGQFDVGIRLFDVPLGGTPLFEESQSNVQFDAAGRFAVYVGLVEELPSALFREQATLYAELEIDGELFPGRILLGAVPYAAQSEFATTCAVAETVAPGAIDASVLPASVIATTALADDAVTSAKIADGAVVTRHLGSDAVTSAQIAPQSVSTSELADSAVDGSKLAPRAVDRTKIAPFTITSSEVDPSLLFPSPPRAVSRRNSNGTSSTRLGSRDRRICFLSYVGFRDIEGGDERAACRVIRTSTEWRLQAELNGTNDADAYCEATCFVF